MDAVTQIARFWRGAERVVVLTASETPFDEAANWKLGDPLEVTLPILRDRILES